MGKELKMQPSLIFMPSYKDVVFTPPGLVEDMINFFNPVGLCLDPCAGDGIFYRYLPIDAEWCEITRGRDFYAWHNKVDWIIGNPPYSSLLAWLRHSFKVADNIVYLMPLHRVFASGAFLDDLFEWGGHYSHTPVWHRLGLGISIRACVGGSPLSRQIFRTNDMVDMWGRR